MKTKLKIRHLLFFAFIFGFWYLAFGICFAAPVGNPAGPVLLDGKYPTKFSLEAETVLERKMKTGNNAKFCGVFYTGKVSFYLGNKLDIYGLVGSYEGKVKNYINETYIIDSKTDIAYGAGVSYVFYAHEFLNGIVRLGGDAKFRHFQPDINNVLQYREKVASKNTAMDFTEWQAAFGLAYQYKRFVPYFGLKCSNLDSRVKFTQGTTSYSEGGIHSEKNWGIFYGLDILATDNMSFNVELRNIDEKAANIGMSARF